MNEIVAWGLIGLVWRWWDGRGYGPGWVRHVVGGMIAAAILMEARAWSALLPSFAVPPLPWGLPALGGRELAGYAGVIVLAVLWSALWAPRQKNRAEFDDMALRWGLAIGVFGALLAGATLSLWPIVVLAPAAVLVAALVWAGVHWRYRPPHAWLDSSAVTEALAGGVAHAALAAAARSF